MTDCIICRIMEQLKKGMGENEAFLSEGDFQYSFARKVEGFGISNVVIEYPYKLKKGRRHTDVSFTYEGKRYFIELKYKTMKFEGAKRHGEDAPNLINQRAVNDAIYQFYYDIEKMENLTGNMKESVAYCIFLTNNQLFWTSHKESSNIAKLNLDDEQKTRQGKFEYRNHKLDIGRQYNIRWQDFTSGFRFLIIKIEPKM